LVKALKSFEDASKSNSVIDYEEDMISNHLFNTKILLQIQKETGLQIHVG